MSIPHPRTRRSYGVSGCGSSSRIARWFRHFLLSVAGLLSASVLSPQAALAHGIVGKADLPIPMWLFSWAAAIVLVVSLVALSSLWRTPQLQQE
jgi:hypothetical protein